MEVPDIAPTLCAKCDTLPYVPLHPELAAWRTARCGVKVDRIFYNYKVVCVCVKLT
jgi:hypothetical protein